MPNTSPNRSERPAPRPPGASRGGTSGGLREWFLSRLDLLLSEELRRCSPSELARNRVLAGASGFMFLNSLLLLVLMRSLMPSLAMALMSLGFLAALVLLRRATSHVLPSLVLCISLALGDTLVTFLANEELPYIGTHAVHMLLPALAVYLLKPRVGFLFCLFTLISMGVLFPLYSLHLQSDAQPSREIFWSIYFFAGSSFVGAWGLGSLHSTARQEVQVSLAQTLTDLRDNKDNLFSLFESTDDLIALLDTEGRLLTANAVAKQAWKMRFHLEPVPGQPLIPESAPELRAVWEPRLQQVLAGQRQRYEEDFELGGSIFTFDISFNPVLGEGGRVKGVTIFARDITLRKQAERRLGEMHRTLMDVSRQAGMAEIATGVLHNVGNTLNSVNISTGLVIDQLRKSRLPGLARATALLRERSSDLTSFLTREPQGQKLPAYLSALSDQLQEEHAAMLQEMRALRDSVDHIKSIVSMQQRHARAAGTVEQLSVPTLVDEALRLHATSFERLGIHIECDYADVPPIPVDRHRLLQILVNLLNNARQALTASDVQNKRLTIHVHPASERGLLLLQVTDNGIGITQENLTRVFTQGFTTKKEGHGFGLHISALAAEEMKGRLTCASPGPGQGATFTLELPLESSGS
jgi:PAS domain S-box-containing protein